MPAVIINGQSHVLSYRCFVGNYSSTLRVSLLHMGACLTLERDEIEARRRSEEIDKQLESLAKERPRIFKILLLGAGESGKSTLVKQMKIIHSDGFTQSELSAFRPTVLDNLLSSMKYVLTGMGLLRINLEHASNKIYAEIVLASPSCFDAGFVCDFCAAEPIIDMLEVCVDSIESVQAAEEGGASRIELCSALSEGGLTPTAGTLKSLKSDLNCKIPIYCMLRPRRGNDFMFTAAEIQSITYDIEILRQFNADGFVFGALDSKGEIDVESCRTILRSAGSLPVTFHRAFDLTSKKDMLKNVQLIKDLGFSRILTSGFESTAELGIDALKELVETSDGITIMPGSGINTENIRKILVKTGCKEFHASARVKMPALEKYSKQISMGGGNEDLEPRMVTCSKLVKELVGIAKNCEFDSK